MFRSLALRRIRAPDGSQTRKEMCFDQFGGLFDRTGLEFPATSSVPDQHRCHPDPSCYSGAHGAHYLDWQNHRLRPLATENHVGARAAVRPSLSFEFMMISVRNFAAPVQAKPAPKTEAFSNNGPRLNEAITAPLVRLVTDEGHSIVSSKEALERAKRLDVDLVEVQRNANPPVCKIMDYHKERFKQEVKEKERAKTKSASSLRSGENKEVRFKGKTELKDLKIKADAIIRLMERGYRVKCIALPTGNAGQDTGELLLRLIPLIEEVSVVESGPHIDAKQAYVIVRHVKFATKKSGKKMSKAMDAVAKGIEAAATDAKAAATVEELERVDGSPESKVEAQQQQPRHRTTFTPPKPGAYSQRSGLEVSKEAPPAVINRYSKRTETREGSHQASSGPPGAAINPGRRQPLPGPPGAARNPGWRPPNSGPPGAARNPGWRPPNSGPPGAARNPGWRPPNSGPPGAARYPDSGGGQGRYGGAMPSRTDGTDSPPSKGYGVFTAPKAAPSVRSPTASPAPPVFGNIGKQKPASSSGGQNSGDSPAGESGSPPPPTRKYGIFSSTKNASSGN